MKIILVCFALFSSSLLFSQKKDQSLNFAGGYNILGYGFHIDGIDMKLSYQKKWFEVGLYSGFIHQTHYKYYDMPPISNSEMYDRFWRVGLLTNFQFLTTDRHLLGAGLHAGKIHLIEHFYYNESGGQVKEVSCSGKECPNSIYYIGDIDYLDFYTFQAGIGINYDFRIWRMLYFSSFLSLEYLAGTTGNGYYGGGQEWAGMTFSTTIGLEYKLPLGKSIKSSDSREDQN